MVHILDICGLPLYVHTGFEEERHDIFGSGGVHTTWG